MGCVKNLSSNAAKSGLWRDCDFPKPGFPDAGILFADWRLMLSLLAAPARGNSFAFFCPSID